MNLDREIAEKVMGYEISDSPVSGIGYVVTAPDGGRTMIHLPFEPSTNIQHAMEVEAEMFRRGFDISHFHHNKEKDTEWEWEAMFTKNNWVKSDQFGKSLPEAICRAALAALEE